jgi:hypothetical protein
MLLHQFIVVVAAWAKRFDTVVVHGINVARRVASRVGLGSGLQDA